MINKELPKDETQAVNLTKTEIFFLHRVLGCYQQSLDEMQKKYFVGVGCSCNIFEIGRKLFDAFQKFEEVDSQLTETESVPHEKSGFTETEQQKQISELATKVAALEERIKDGKTYVVTDGACDIDYIAEIVAKRIEIRKRGDITDTKKILEHFGISERDCGEISIFSSEKIDHIGAAIEFDLAKEKGRAVIRYDPAYPFAVMQIHTD